MYANNLIHNVWMKNCLYVCVCVHICVHGCALVNMAVH